METNRDSFHRFNDEFIELFLSYLSLDEKFSFESVCNNWKQFIFKKQFILKISALDDKNCIKSLVFNKKFSPFSHINTDWLEILLKKCKNINELVFDSRVGHKIGCDSYIKLFEVISNNCHNLENFVFNVSAHKQSFIKDNDLSKALIQFMDKFGPNLKYFDCYEFCLKNQLMKEVLVKTPSIKTVYFNDISVFNELNDKQFLTKLEEIKFWKFNCEQLMSFTDKYHKQIKRIIINIHSMSGSDTNHLDLNQVLLQLSRFEKLEELSLEINCGQGLVGQGLDAISDNCQHLRQLTFLIKSTHFPISFENKVMKTFAKFKSLKSLEIEKCLSDSSFESFNCFIGVKQLSHLSLEDMSLTDYCFKDIHLYLPQLKSISLRDMSIISDQTLYYLSQLPNLSNVEFRDIDLREEALICFIKNCSSLKTIEISINIEINDELINEMIECAKRKPKVYHNFLLSIKKTYFYKTHHLPNNLNITLQIDGIKRVLPNY